MSKTLTKKLISTFVMLIMILSAFVVISSNVSAQPSAQPAQVGTFTLNPATGAFPGQLVTYTWTGVPSNLTAPVYVTVYLNDTPYYTSEAAYSGTVLTGTFTMPNDNVGTVFTVSLSYKDSSHNYGVSSLQRSTGSVNVYAAPIGYYTHTYTASTFGVPYTLNANLNLSAPTTVKTDFNGGTGNLTGYTNSTFNVVAGTTNLKTNSTATANVYIETTYGKLVQFTSSDTKQNLTINTTAYNGSVATLSLPATTLFNSNFTFSGNNIASIALNAQINEIWNSIPVVFNMTGKYTALITAPGNYSFTGSVAAIKPLSLASAFSGSLSATYDIVSFYHGASTNYVNYTLSTSLTGATTDKVVTLKAQYLNDTVNNALSTKSYVLSTDKLTVQAGYAFTSIYVDLENPGISGTFVNNFVHGSLSTGNLSFSFTSLKTGPLSTISTSTWYDNMTGITVSLANQTLKGYLNMTVTTNNYAPGVDYISAAIWNVTDSINLYLNDSNGLSIKGSTSAIIPYNTTVLTSGATKNVPETFNFTMTTYFYDMLGYPYLTEFNVPYTSYTLNYSAAKELALVSQNFTWTGSKNLSVGSIANHVYSNVTGFNTTLNGLINIWVNVTDVNPVMYAFTGAGNVSAYVTLKGTLTVPHISESFLGNFTFPKPATFNLVNKWNYNSTSRLSNNTSATYTLANIGGTVNVATVSAGSVSYTTPFYSGAVGITGKSYTPAKTIALTPGTAKTSAGNITSISGFGNTTILGWYNTTFTVGTIVPALYGLSSMNGFASIYANVTIHNVTHSLSIDPYYNGLQNTTFTVSIPSKIPKYSGNVTYAATEISQNLTVVGTGYKGYLNDLSITGTFSVTNPIYNLTDNFAYSFSLASLPFFSISSYPGGELSFISGDVPITYNSSTTTFYGYVSSPIQNLTLVPLANFSLSVTFSAGNSDQDYSIYDGLFTATHSEPFAIKNNTKFQFSDTGKGSAYIETYVQISSVILSGQANGITFTTNPITVENAGLIPISGLSTTQFGSGTVAGTINVAKYFPNNWSAVNEPSMMILAGQFIVQGFYANGTQYYITVNLMSTPANLSYEMSITTPVSAQITTTIYSESSYSGASTAVSYALLQGNGALLTGISSSQIATIEAAVNKTVSTSMQVPLSELSANITKLNGDIVTIETAFGNMTSTLQAINANVVSVAAGVAVLSTDIGFVQTSLNTLSPIIMSISNTTAHIATMAGNITLSLSALNAKITAVNGTVATLNTSMGTVITSLSSIDAKVTSISGTVATISTSLGTLTGTVTNISNRVATIQTNLGTLTTTVSGIKTTTSSTSSSVGNTMIFEIVVLVLILVTLALVAYTIGQVRKQGPKKPEEIKAPEEEKKE
jgi:hypothetical protein